VSFFLSLTITVCPPPPLSPFLSLLLSLPSFFVSSFLFLLFLGSTDGTKGYQSGEFVRYKNDEHKDKDWRPNNDDFKRADMFAFGVLMHFVLGEGSHPFSDPRRPNRVPVREDRIADEVPPNLKAVKDFEARHLIEKCVEHNAEERPSGERATAHPYFYGTKERIAVIGEVARNSKGGGREKEKKEKEVRWKEEFSECWEREEAGTLLMEGRQTNFYRDTEKDLVRFLRNAIEHGQEHVGGKGKATKLALSIRGGGGGGGRGGGGGTEFGEAIVRWIKSKKGAARKLWTRMYDEGVKS